jgi:hypothetical protein
MRLTAPRKLRLIVLCTVSLAAAISSNAQTAPTAVPPATAPTSSESPANPTRPENFNGALSEPQLSAETGRFFTGSLTSTPALTMVAFERCCTGVGRT